MTKILTFKAKPTKAQNVTVSMVESCNHILSKLEPRTPFVVNANELANVAELFNANKWIMQINEIAYSEKGDLKFAVFMVTSEQLEALVG